MKSFYYSITLFVFCCFFFYCTPIIKWQKSSYLNSSNLKQTNNTKKKKDLIRVHIYTGGAQTVSISKSQSGQYTFTTKTKKNTGTKTLKITQEGTFCSSRGTFYFRQNLYKGCLQVVKASQVKSNRFIYISISTFKDYLTSVIGHEMNSTWPVEALKAQAILARTYALNKIKKNTNKHYDIVSSTNAQVYYGIPKRDLPKLKNIVQSTKKQILTYKKRIAHVFYHASSGGITASSEEVWGSKIPYLKKRVIHLERGKNSYHWIKKIPLSSFLKILNVHKIKKVKVSARTKSKRVQEITFKTSQGTKVVSAKKIRRLIGAKVIPSTLFKIKKIKKNMLIIEGFGYGHGVGLSQWGAKHMADKNYSHKRILKIFFPGTRIQKINSKKHL